MWNFFNSVLREDFNSCRIKRVTVLKDSILSREKALSFVEYFSMKALSSSNLDSFLNSLAWYFFRSRAKHYHFFKKINFFHTQLFVFLYKAKIIQITHIALVVCKLCDRFLNLMTLAPIPAPIVSFRCRNCGRRNLLKYRLLRKHVIGTNGRNLKNIIRHQWIFIKIIMPDTPFKIRELHW